MSYRKAEDVLPRKLIEEIQQYVDGTQIYIPCRTKQEWGSRTRSKDFFRERNKRIYEDYRNGTSRKELARIFSLSEKRIQRIIRDQRQMRIAMEDTVYYHVISDIPKKIGDRMRLDEQHPNHVQKRVYAEMEKVQDIYRAPEAYKGQTLSHEVKVALRELAMEKVRREKFATYPSRLASLYVSRTFEEAKRWEEYFIRIGRPTFGIAKIRVCGETFVGDAAKCFDGGVDEAENLRLAELYWQNGADGQEPIVEILVNGDIEIMEILTEYTYVTLRERPELRNTAAAWFHSKWGVPEEAYLECMNDYLDGKTEYGWYLCLHGDRIVGGMGVIENDFHDRKDLAPNVCAVYTEEDHRCQGIAGHLLNMVVRDMKEKGISPIYLVTDHIGFYERYGWELYCMAQGDGEPEPTRLYIHR